MTTGRKPRYNAIGTLIFMVIFITHGKKCRRAYLCFRIEPISSTHRNNTEHAELDESNYEPHYRYVDISTVQWLHGRNHLFN